MAKQLYRKTAYGLSDPILNVPDGAIVAKRDPTILDRAQIGTEWVNTITNTAFILTSIEDNTSNWEIITNAADVIQFDTDSGAAIPAAGIVNILGSDGISTFGSGDTVTIDGAAFATTYDSDSGSATPSAGIITFSGGTGITTAASGSTVTINSTGGGGITTLVGDDSSTATGSMVNVITGEVTGPNANGTAHFTGDNVSTLTLSFSDINSNTGIGVSSLASVIGGSNSNVCLGDFSGTGITNGFSNILIGYQAGASINIGGANCMLGQDAGSSTQSGFNNIMIGQNAGSVQVGTESYNIYLNNGGANNESNTLRIGAATGTAPSDLAAAYICGIDGVDLSTTEIVTMASDQLGSATLTPGSGISITPGANTITIANTASGGASTFHTDSGDATQSAGAITIAGGTNMNTSGSGSTVTVNLDGSITLTSVTSNGVTLPSGNVDIQDGNLLLPATTSTTGYIFLGGNPYISAFGTNNTFHGEDSGNNTLTSANCVGFGDFSLNALTNSIRCTAIGFESQTNNDTASNNTSVGYGTLLEVNGAGVENTIMGARAGESISTGNDNTGIGFFSLRVISTGSNNCALGANSGNALTGSDSSNIIISNTGTSGDNNTIRIGTSGSGSGQQNSTFIVGIQGVTVTGTPVLVSATDQLGIAVSSKRFKNEIQDMESASEALYKLRPVTFTWNRSSAPGLADAPTDRQYGLIAEEVANVIPQIVNFEKNGDPLSVNYGDLTSLLVNEIQKLQARIAVLEAR